MTSPLFMVMASALRDPAAPWTASERLVAVVVGDCMNASGEARPSIALISQRTRLGRRTVQRALAQLTKPGGLFREQTGGSTPDGGRLASTYRLSTRATMAQVPAPEERRSDPPTCATVAHTRANNDADQRHSGALSNGRSTHIATRAMVAQVARGGWPGAFAAKYTSVLGGILEPGRIGKALEGLVKAHGESATLAGWTAYLQRAADLSREERRFVSPTDFARRAGDFIPSAKPAPAPPPPEARGPVFAEPRKYPS